MDCPNCSESFRLRSAYAQHIGNCLPKMIIDPSRGLLVTTIGRVREGARGTPPAGRREPATVR